MYSRIIAALVSLHRFLAPFVLLSASVFATHEECEIHLMRGYIDVQMSFRMNPDQLSPNESRAYRLDALTHLCADKPLGGFHTDLEGWSPQEEEALILGLTAHLRREGSRHGFCSLGVSAQTLETLLKHEDFAKALKKAPALRLRFYGTRAYKSWEDLCRLEDVVSLDFSYALPLYITCDYPYVLARWPRLHTLCVRGFFDKETSLLCFAAYLKKAQGLRTLIIWDIFQWCDDYGTALSDAFMGSTSLQHLQLHSTLPAIQSRLDPLCDAVNTRTQSL
ncbi:MAG: hypothetical protein C0514_01080 [Candidatus Puniceispirillum sp.]|nr:hypothetical protein [Candidatus Puniceispirillum sp.]